MLSDGGPRGLADEPLCARVLGVPALLDIGAISDSGASDIKMEAIVAVRSERCCVIIWRGSGEYFQEFTKVGGNIGTRLARLDATWATVIEWFS